MIKMTEIHWNGIPIESGVVVIDLEKNNQTSSELDTTAERLLKHNLAGYVDDKSAVKLIDPKARTNKSELNITNHTLIEKGGSDMSDKTDNRYIDLKEDLRESERRISQDLRDRESRFEKSMERYSQEAKEREERFMKNIEEIKTIVADGE